MDPSTVNIKHARGYVGGLTLFFVSYLTLPILAPILMYFGQTSIARVIYTIYSFLCHQRAERSFFLYGEAPMYELGELQEMGLNTINDLRHYEGDHDHGFKLGFCCRCMGIHTGMVVSGIAFTINPLLAKPLRAKYVLIGILPMALDGVIQLIAEAVSLAGLKLWGLVQLGEPFYVSNNIRRFVTGLIFGLTVGFWLYPSIVYEFATPQNKK